MRHPHFLAAVFVLFFAGFAYAQTDDAPEEPPSEGEAALPRSFRQISLGMDLDGLKTILREDGMFYFREDRDVSLVPSAQDQTLVETQGRSFIRRAFFQLRDGGVFIMSFDLNAALVDHYSVFSAFRSRYGEPGSLNPREAVWETEDTRISIERPLTVKYIDKQSFAAPAQSASAPSADGSRELLSRNEFLDGF